MKIGDKVKFLSETGGGRVAGFQGKNIVLVEDEDGFQIPTPINEVVVVNQEDYSTANVINRRSAAMEQKATETPLQRGNRSVKAMMQEGMDDAVDMSQPDTVDLNKEVTFRPQAEERSGGNKLSAYLAFVPMTDNSINHPHFEAYFVNDSNYYLQYACLVTEGNSCSLKAPFLGQGPRERAVPFGTAEVLQGSHLRGYALLRGASAALYHRGE